MEALSQSFRALGDPTRLRILRLVAAAPLNVSELVSVVGVAQSSVSHHLGKLRQLGLVREERAAGFTYYSLAVDAGDVQAPLIKMACEAEDRTGDLARLKDLLRQREDRQILNERLLEPGQSWFRWARSVVAIDQNRAALAQARARAKREGLDNVTFLRGDLHHLSLPSGKTGL